MIPNDPFRADRIPNYHVDWTSPCPPEGYIDRPIPTDPEKTHKIRKSVRFSTPAATESSPSQTIMRQPIPTRVVKTSISYAQPSLEELDLENHWAFGGMDLNSSFESTLEQLSELQENTYANYFLCTEGDLSATERLDRTRQAILSFPKDACSLAIMLDYFTSKLPEMIPNWVDLYLTQFRQDPDLRLSLPASVLLPQDQLQYACRSMPDTLIPKVVDIFMQGVTNSLELAELRTKLDFTRIAARFTDPTLTIEEIFSCSDIPEDCMKYWIQENQETLKSKIHWVLPDGTQCIPDLLIQELTGIKNVQLTQGNFTVFPFESLKNLLNLPQLETLNLSQNSFTDFPIGLLSNAKKLKTLNLSGNPLAPGVKIALENYCSRRGITLMI